MKWTLVVLTAVIFLSAGQAFADNFRCSFLKREFLPTIAKGVLK